jgi:hypothetical protein
MTCQPAIDVGILFIMAFNAFAHAPFLVGQALVVLNLSVAFLAGNFAVDVPLVIEQNMLGDIVDFFPGRGCFRIVIFMLLLDPRVFFNDIVVAVQAFFHRRYARVIGIGNIGMAILALDLLDPAVDRVAEGDWLLRSEGPSRPLPKNVDEGGR